MTDFKRVKLVVESIQRLRTTQKEYEKAVRDVYTEFKFNPKILQYPSNLVNFIHWGESITRPGYDWSRLASTHSRKAWERLKDL